MHTADPAGARHNRVTRSLHATSGQNGSGSPPRTPAVASGGAPGRHPHEDEIRHRTPPGPAAGARPCRLRLGERLEHILELGPGAHERRELERRTAATAAPPAVADLGAAEHPGISQFPPANGRSLRKLATLVSSSAQLGAATGTFIPGTQRLAFGLNTNAGAFVYAPTAIYISRGASSPAKGPFLAPADPTTVPLADRSQQNAGPGGLQAIYAAQLPIPKAGHLHRPRAVADQQGSHRLPGRDRRRQVLADPRRRPASARHRH